MIMSALAMRLPRSAWSGLIVRPETVLGWHRALVRRKWAVYGRRRRPGRPRMPEECCQLILRLARENPQWVCGSKITSKPSSRCGAKPKAPTSGSPQGLEMPMIEGEHIENSEALGENNDRGVGKANVVVPIAAKDCSG